MNDGFPEQIIRDDLRKKQSPIIPDHPKPWKITGATVTRDTINTAEIDMVNSPPHYQVLPGVEVIDIRKAILEKIPNGSVRYTAVDDWSRAWEYLTRMWGKNGLEDAKKSRFYLNRLIKSMEELEQATS